jgi:hypothetical protein
MRATKRPRTSPQAAKTHLDELLDEALKETFPASDPIAVAVELTRARDRGEDPDGRSTEGRPEE